MALPSVSLASAFPNPSSSGRRSSFSKAAAGGILIALFATLVAAQETSGPRFRLGFADHPVSLEAVPGEVLSFDVYLTLTTVENDSANGVQGWSTSMGVEGGAPELITHEGVLVSTVWHEDHDGDPDTPPVVHDPYFQDLGRVESQGGFELISLGFHYLDPERKGAVSAVVLKLTELKTLQPAGTQPIARLRVSVVAGAADSTVRLYYEDGFRAPETMSVNNYVTLGGASYVPELGSAEIPLRVQTVPFKLGDSNVDGSQDLSDAIFTLNYLFQGGPASSCMKTMDLTGDNEVDISDPVFLLNFLFLHSRTPREPYRECGLDPLTTLIRCDSFPPCAAGSGGGREEG